MNTEKYIYIRQRKFVQDTVGGRKYFDGTHRRGLVMVTNIDGAVVISASYCAAGDKFSRDAAIGIARKKAVKYNNFIHTPTTLNSVVTIDNVAFIRTIDPATVNLAQLMLNLGICSAIWNPDSCYLTPDPNQLLDAIKHEIKDSLEGR